MCRGRRQAVSAERNRRAEEGVLRESEVETDRKAWRLVGRVLIPGTVLASLSYPALA